jgi:hypothetical protein
MLAEIITGLKGAVETVQRRGARKTAQDDAALAAIYAASNETRLYIRHTLQRNSRDEQREAELSRLWAKAAVPVRHLDRDLADRCLHKADYWTSPDRWTVAQIREFRIGLDEVYEYARQLLRE